MNIPVIINGEKFIIQSACDTSLLSVLRKNKLINSKRGCEDGICGSCTVLLEGKPVPSCQVPVVLAINKKIETLEHFSKSELYSDIMKGFNRAGIKLCGYCNSGKIFAAYSILTAKEKPTRAKVEEQIAHLSCCCTDYNSLTNGILYAFEIHTKRLQTI